MKQLVIGVILLMAISGCAYPADLGSDIGEAIGKIVLLPTTTQFLLYTGCAAYYAEHNHWPQTKESFAQGIKNSEDKTAKELNSLDELIYYNFYPLKNGDVLIEGGFNQEITEQLVSSGISKCLFSVIAHKTEDGFSFTPSEKTKNNRDYFSLPLNFKVKKEKEDNK
jgi:hypothetical protein